MEHGNVNNTVKTRYVFILNLFLFLLKNLTCMKYTNAETNKLAINPKNKIKYIGIRPGEKIHEEMISNSEALNVIEYKNHFVLIPHSEFLSWNKKKYMQLNKGGKLCKDDFSYNSKTNKEFLKPQQLQKLIKSHLSDFE